jgi:hypothetical protein
VTHEDILLVVLVFAWLARMAHTRIWAWCANPLNRPIGLYTTVSGGYGAGMVSKVRQRMTGFFVLSTSSISWSISSPLTSPQRSRSLHLGAAAGFIVSIVAMVQIPGGGRVSAPFEGEEGEPNTLGGYLLFVGAISAGLALNLPKARLRWMLMALVAVMLVPFLFTLSRASYAGLPLVYLALVFLHRKKRALMIGLMLLFGVMALVMMPQVVKDRIFSTFNPEYTRRYDQAAIGGVKLDTSTTERVRSWQKAVEDIVESPIWGFGVTGYGFLDAQYPRIMVETGLLGLVTFFMLVNAVYKGCKRVFDTATDPLYRGLAMGTLADLAGLLALAGLTLLSSCVSWNPSGWWWSGDRRLEDGTASGGPGGTCNNRSGGGCSGLPAWLPAAWYPSWRTWGDACWPLGSSGCWPWAYWSSMRWAWPTRWEWGRRWWSAGRWTRRPATPPSTSPCSWAAPSAPWRG